MLSSKVYSFQMFLKQFVYSSFGGTDMPYLLRISVIFKIEHENFGCHFAAIVYMPHFNISL